MPSINGIARPCAFKDCVLPLSHLAFVALTFQLTMSDKSPQIRKQLFRSISNRISDTEEPANKTPTNHRILSSFAYKSKTTPETASEGNTTDRVLLNQSANELDYIDYDYRIFNTKHPLRWSKIKALEQSETTTNYFFDTESESTDRIHTLNYGLHSSATNDDDDNDDDNDDSDSESNRVLEIIPGLTKALTKQVLDNFSGKRKPLSQKVNKLGNLLSIFPNHNSFLQDMNINELEEFKEIAQDLKWELSQARKSHHTTTDIWPLDEAQFYQNKEQVMSLLRSSVKQDLESEI
ncbi:GQ67_00694T0 [Komagataella phaffii]|nr:GQ67_00694T0 [Komagataella phaffii]AOA67761.1 GQ68_00694T0 [Komagataella phaffii GS115]